MQGIYCCSWTFAAVAVPTASFGAGAGGPGGEIGPYKPLKILGQGGYGIVYLAEQQRPVNCRVALKVIEPGMDTKEVIARFEAERQGPLGLEKDCGGTVAGYNV